LRSPNDIVTASKEPSANGRCVASAAGEGHIGTAATTDSEHAQREVGRDDVDTGVGQRLGARAGPGGDVEDAVAGSASERRDRRLAPEPVLSEREDVVGEVVPGSDPVEHSRDVGRVLVEGGAVHGGIVSQRL
jgi:hypothetical protein